MVKNKDLTSRFSVVDNFELASSFFSKISFICFNLAISKSSFETLNGLNSGEFKIFGMISLQAAARTQGIEEFRDSLFECRV